MRAVFLPKRTTSVLQILDLGVIASLKKRYQQKLSQRAVELIENNHFSSIYRVDLKMAITWVYEVWTRMESSINSNCWRKSMLV